MSEHFCDGLVGTREAKRIKPFLNQRFKCYYIYIYVCFFVVDSLPSESTFSSFLHRFADPGMKLPSSAVSPLSVQIAGARLKKTNSKNGMYFVRV